MLEEALDPPIRTLTPAQVEERRAKGLCFRCDECFTPGHRCSKLIGSVMLIDGPEEDDEIDDDGECREETHEEAVEEGVEEDIQAEILMHAYSGTFTPRTLQVDGLVRKDYVHILVDLGSTQLSR